MLEVLKVQELNLVLDGNFIFILFFFKKKMPELVATGLPVQGGLVYIDFFFFLGKKKDLFVGINRSWQRLQLVKHVSLQRSLHLRIVLIRNSGTAKLIICRLMRFLRR